MESIRQMASSDLKNGVLSQLANLYCDIWKEPPWNEFFWKPEEVIQDIQRELALPFAKAFLAFNEGEVIGFSWGYCVSREEMRIIADNDKLDHLFECEHPVFYVDELGVHPAFRGRGVGKKLSRCLISTISEEQAARKIVLRTDEKAMPARRVYEELNFQELPVHDGKHPDRTYWLLNVK